MQLNYGALVVALRPGWWDCDVLARLGGGVPHWRRSATILRIAGRGVLLMGDQAHGIMEGWEDGRMEGEAVKGSVN